MDKFMEFLAITGLMLILLVSTVGTGITIITGFIDMFNNRKYRKK